MSVSAKNRKATIKAAPRDKQARYEVSSGNVFADLGLPSPDLELVKANFAFAILARIRSVGLTQAQAAERMGIDQPRVSRIGSGRLREFSIDTLITSRSRSGSTPTSE